MEKRWNFTLRDLDARAPAFDHLCSLIELAELNDASDLRDATEFRDATEDGSLYPRLHAASKGIDQASRGEPSQSEGRMQLQLGKAGFQNCPRFIGGRIDVETVRQRLVYKRNPDLELLELRLSPAL